MCGDKTHMFVSKMSYEIEVCYKAISSSFCFFNHFFMRIPKLELEIHPGKYVMGTHHCLNFTKNYSIAEIKTICSKCLDELMNNADDLTPLWYYPYINCETLTRGLVGGIPVSFQSVSIAILLVIFVKSLLKAHYLLFVSLFILIFFILQNNFYLPIRYTSCKHL